MSIQSKSVSEEEEGLGTEHPSHHPPAPAGELFDIATTVDPSYVISLIRKLLPPTMNAASTSNKVSGGDFATQGTNGSSDAEEKNSENKCEEKQEGMNDKSKDQGTQVVPSVGDASWEEYGCILWDLSTSRTHAKLMVQNLILEVILATLMISKSPRVTEISLGIIGNLACHEAPRKEITCVIGLVEIIVDQIFVDDTPCLCEEFRLLTLCLQGTEGITWAHALKPENIISRILWIAENTLNPQLIEKSVGFLLTIAESEDEVRPILLPHLVTLGLPVILVNLLAFEISKLEGDERLPERYPVLDVILRAIESVYIIPGYAQEFNSNKKLLPLLSTLIKLNDKIEVATSCVTAAVLIANLLHRNDDLILEINQDLCFLQGLVDIFPFASDDIEARNAVWDVISMLLALVQEGETSPTNLHQHISVLSSKLDLIEEELLDHQLAASDKEKEESITSSTNPLIRTVALKRIDSIVSQWLTLKDQASSTSFLVNERDLDRLKDCCRKYSNVLGSS